MSKLLTEILNLIFPPRETEKILQSISPETKTNFYRPDRFSSIIYLSEYQNKFISASIIENKFHYNKHGAKILGELLTKWDLEQDSKSLYVSVPLGKSRRKERGYNQVETILQSASSSLNCDHKLLIRTIETKQQSKLSKLERQMNVKGVFAFNKTKTDLIQFNQVVILDDVVTTGATLESAREVLLEHLPEGMKVVCLAIAH